MPSDAAGGLVAVCGPASLSVGVRRLKRHVPLTHRCRVPRVLPLALARACLPHLMVVRLMVDRCVQQSAVLSAGRCFGLKAIAAVALKACG